MPTKNGLAMYKEMLKIHLKQILKNFGCRYRLHKISKISNKLGLLAGMVLFNLKSQTLTGVVHLFGKTANFVWYTVWSIIFLVIGYL